MKAFEFKPKLFTTLQNYSKESFMADLMAGIIVGIVALPLAIAFGIASGVSPEKGIITAIVAGFIRCIQAGSCYQIYSLSHYCRIYQWYCRHHFYDTDCRYLRTELRRRKSTGRLYRQMDDLFPSF